MFVNTALLFISSLMGLHVTGEAKTISISSVCINSCYNWAFIWQWCAFNNMGNGII